MHVIVNRNPIHATMNNELQTELNDLSRLPTGSPSFIQHYQLERLHNRINLLLDREASIGSEIEAQNRLLEQRRRQVDESKSALDDARRFNESFRRAVYALWTCVAIFLNVDVRSTMRRIVDDIRSLTMPSTTSATPNDDSVNHQVPRHCR
jgi:hypothetical protein